MLGVPALTPLGWVVSAQFGGAVMSRIGVRPAASAFASTESSWSHEYPAEVGSLATKPDAGDDGAMLFQVAGRRTYVAPAPRAMSRPSCRSGLLLLKSE